jgi:hypothetical protein
MTVSEWQSRHLRDAMIWYWTLLLKDLSGWLPDENSWWQAVQSSVPWTDSLNA